MRVCSPSSPDAVRDRIRRYVGRGIDFLKYAATTHHGRPAQYIQFSPRVQRIVVEEAHRAGLTVQAHSSSVEGLHLAVEAGVDLLQHCETTGPEPIPEETLALMVKRRVACAIFPNTAKAAAFYREQAKDSPFFGRYEVMARNQRALMRAGAVLVLATDGGVFSVETKRWPWLQKRYPPEENLVELGEGHFYWLLAVEQLGMRPMDALMAATRNVARAYKLEQDLGTLETGKIADLVVLERNPLEGARNYRNITWVVKEGKVVHREGLPTKRILTARRRSQNDSEEGRRDAAEEARADMDHCY